MSDKDEVFKLARLLKEKAPVRVYYVWLGHLDAATVTDVQLSQPTRWSNPLFMLNVEIESEIDKEYWYLTMDNYKRYYLNYWDAYARLVRDNEAFNEQQTS